MSSSKNTKTDNVSSDTIGSTSKVDRYGWTDPSKPGALRWIDKHELKVDHRYQRKGDNDKANRLAKEFQWPAFGVLIVAERANGMFVAEGQHRHLASLKRNDVQKVPCIVFQSEGIAFEARVFLAANGNRKPVTAVAKYKAAVLSKDPIALKVKGLAESVGRTVELRQSPNTVSCVATMNRLAQSNPECLDRVWPLIASLCAGGPIPDRVVDALAYMEARMPEGESLTDARWQSRLVGIGLDGLNECMVKAAAFYARGGAKVWADGITRRLNKGLRDANKLTLRGA